MERQAFVGMGGREEGGEGGNSKIRLVSTCAQHCTLSFSMYNSESLFTTHITFLHPKRIGTKMLLNEPTRQNFSRKVEHLRV